LKGRKKDLDNSFGKKQDQKRKKENLNLAGVAKIEKVHQKDAFISNLEIWQGKDLIKDRQLNSF
jgi:hypothetical protein